MNYTEIEIDWMKELLKENELEIWRLRKEIKNLKEERDFFKEQATLWRNDYKNEYEKNKKLEEESEWYKKQYEHTMWDYIDEDLYDLDC